MKYKWEKIQIKSWTLFGTKMFNEAKCGSIGGDLPLGQAVARSKPCTRLKDMSTEGLSSNSERGHVRGRLEKGPIS